MKKHNLCICVLLERCEICAGVKRFKSKSEIPKQKKDMVGSDSCRQGLKHEEELGSCIHS